jgi:hypothetical protein
MGISAIQLNCDPEQATQFSANGKGRVGYVTYFKLSSKTFNEPKKYNGPLNEKVNAIGIITAAEWRGGELDPVAFEMLVSMDVRKAALQFMDTPSADAGIEIAFEIYDHFVKESDKKTVYYKAFFTDGNVNAVITPDGSKKLRFVADPDAENCYKNALYPISLAIIPAAGKQALHFARVEGSPQAAEWGH